MHTFVGHRGPGDVWRVYIVPRSWEHQVTCWKKTWPVSFQVYKLIPDLADQEVCQIKLALTGQIPSAHQYREAVGQTGCPFPYQSNEDLFLFLLNCADLSVVMFNMCNCICLLKDGLMGNIPMTNSSVQFAIYRWCGDLSTLQKKHKMMPHSKQQ